MLASMRRDPLAFVIGPIALAGERSRWGVRSGSDATYYGRFPDCPSACQSCSSITGDRFVRVRDDMHVTRWLLWDSRLLEFVSGDEAARRRRESKPGIT